MSIQGFSGMYEFDNKTIPELQAILNLMLYNTRVNRQILAIKAHPVLNAFKSMGAMNENASANPIETVLETDLSENVKKLDGLDDEVLSSDQEDAELAYVDYEHITDTVVVNANKFTRLKGDAAVDNYIKRKFRKILVSAPYKMAKCAVDETISGADDVFTGLDSYITTSAGTVMNINQSTAKNSEGIAYWDNQRKTSATWSESGTSDAIKLIGACNDLTGLGSVDLILYNNEAWYAYQEELSAKGLLEQSDGKLVRKMQDAGLESLGLLGIPFIREPNMKISSNTALTKGRGYFINSKHFKLQVVKQAFPANVQSGAAEFATWLGRLSDFEKISATKYNWISIIDIWATFWTDYLAKNGVHIITSATT